MAEKEFNLNEKRKELFDYLIEQFGDKSMIPCDILRVVERQDKEFTKGLRNKLCKNYTERFREENNRENCDCENCKIINKLEED